MEQEPEILIAGKEKKGREMTPDEQLAEWVKGNSIHNDTTGECCPDFSCCQPKLGIPIEQRLLFQRSGQRVRYEMLGMFLGAAIAGLTEGKEMKVYIAEDEPG